MSLRNFIVQHLSQSLLSQILITGLHIGTLRFCTTQWCILEKIMARNQLYNIPILKCRIFPWTKFLSTISRINNNWICTFLQLAQSPPRDYSTCKHISNFISKTSVGRWGKAQVTTSSLAEPSAEVVRVICLRLILLSETRTLLRPMTFGPSERGIFTPDLSSPRLLSSGIKYPTFFAQNNIENN